MAKKNNDEEISIDFSKITNLFKKVKKEKKTIKKEEIKLEQDIKTEIADEKKLLKEASKVEKAMEKEEEISFDFSKIKDFFKENGKSKNIFSFFVKYQTVFLILIPLLMAIFVRMPAMNLPITDSWAEKTVYANYKNQISNQIISQYPNLPELNKNNLIDQEFNKVLTSQKEQINEQIKQASQYFKSTYQYEENGKLYTYMPDIDPYVYLEYARNYLEKGHTYDELKNGTPWNIHELAPIGSKVNIKDAHPYILAYINKIINLFVKTPLMQTSGFFPIIFMALAVIPAFFIARKFAGNTGGFFAALMIAVNAAITGRTTWGHADTDAYNIFFPLFIVWMFIEAFDSKNKKKSVILSLAAGFTTAIYSMTWGGWWYIFDLVLGAIVIYYIYSLIKNRTIQKMYSENKINLLSSGIYIVSSFILITLINSFDAMKQFIAGPLSFIIIKSASHANLWPNVYTTVAELNSASLSSIINSIGGTLMFLIALVGIGLLLMKKENKESNVKFSILLILWIFGMIYASTKGIRFTFVLGSAFAIAFGISLGLLYQHLTEWLSSGMSMNKTFAKAILLMLFLVLFITPIKTSYSTAKNDIPIINDAWYNSLTKIKTESQPDAIINSWWDFGHHFKYLADRAVTFDGGSQNTPMAHWIGYTLLTSNENEAIGILRMLDCGSNSAFNELDKTINNTHKSVNILHKIVALSKEDAIIEFSKYGLKGEQISQVLQYTHCNPPENYFITSEDMVGKAGVWAHFGSWNFERAEIWNKKNMNKNDLINFMKSDFNYTQEKSEQLYYEVQAIKDETEANTWIASWPSYVAGEGPCNTENNTLICYNSISSQTFAFKVDLATMNATIPTQSGEMYPYSLVYPTEKGVGEIFYTTADNKNKIIPYTIMISNKENSTFNIVMQPELSKSMFTRLFFMDSHGLEHFELFSAERDITGQNIYVWKVKW
jgi:dolichyl-diphosphooligosaccharide--protein glycosyltransferase